MQVKQINTPLHTPLVTLLMLTPQAHARAMSTPWMCLLSVLVVNRLGACGAWPRMCLAISTTSADASAMYILALESSVSGPARAGAAGRPPVCRAAAADGLADGLPSLQQACCRQLGMDSMLCHIQLLIMHMLCVQVNHTCFQSLAWVTAFVLVVVYTAGGASSHINICSRPLIRYEACLLQHLVAAGHASTQISDHDP
jgi:hypothetical protein